MGAKREGGHILQHRMKDGAVHPCILCVRDEPVLYDASRMGPSDVFLDANGDQRTRASEPDEDVLRARLLRWMDFRLAAKVSDVLR